MTIQQLMDQCSSGIYAALELCVEKDVFITAHTAIKVLFCKINFIDGTVEIEVASYMSTKAIPILTRANIDNLVENTQTSWIEKLKILLVMEVIGSFRKFKL